ncbi:MAG: hypothetical protein WKG07_08225 [Hymenobacter sp.]
MRENNPTKPNDPLAPLLQNTAYETPGHARNLCFIWPDGKQHFINYAYLVGGELTTGGETNVVILNFSAYTVTLKGYRLEQIFHALLDHLPRCVTVMDKRYSDSIDEDQSVVTDISVVKSER